MSSPPRQDTTVSDQYDAWARVYDRLWRRYMNQTLPVLQTSAAVAPGDRVLDLACGTGDLLARMARDTPGAALAGIDLTGEMVRRARQKLAAVPEAQIEEADAHDLPFGDEAFDIVVCASTLHYFTHPDQVLGEARRVLRPGGRLVVLDWCRDFWTCRVMDAMLQLVDPAHGACYTLGELRALLRKSGFGVRFDFRYRFDLVWGMMVAEARPAPDP